MASRTPCDKPRLLSLKLNLGCILKGWLSPSDEQFSWWTKAIFQEAAEFLIAASSVFLLSSCSPPMQEHPCLSHSCSCSLLTVTAAGCTVLLEAFREISSCFQELLLNVQYDCSPDFQPPISAHIFMFHLGNEYFSPFLLSRAERDV